MMDETASAQVTYSRVASSTKAISLLIPLMISGYVPMKDYSVTPLPASKYSWETTYIPSEGAASLDQYGIEFLQRFASKMLAESVDIPVEFEDVIAKRFWDMI
jgi:hypothetical protein